ncbi:leucine-rich repeats and immunoglobulin-like domains protein 1 [Hyposmocoma kahamanoa]|uniref:leucine-rich repeats and immunoglobulin-like domains protein 1 n=1 Tax=Hyposmocoma kahamanoa TaxID=1477025 RepID=UPI000E6D5E04|nr:leucine-rich repeats and immunoglobulin-like domains protein 1 [Hyposmocoma kahamanoa]
MHDNRCLNKAQKIQHLKSKVRGEAERIKQHLHITAENYDTAWDLLTHSVPENCFAGFSHLKYLNLSHNSISYLSVAAFEGISQLESLYLSYNKLSSIANIAIKLRNLKSLDLSNNNLKYVGNYTFSNSTVRSINLSTNAISEIKTLTFSSVSDLQELDLSNNALTTLAFLNLGCGSDLKKLYFHKNMVDKVSNNTFAKVPSLEHLDLSYNVIQSIESGAFIHLKKLENLLLHNNRLFSIQIINLEGLSALLKFDLSYTEIGNFTKAAVSGLKTTIFNCSHAELSYIHFDTFAEVEHIDILDLSYNSLVTFEINPKGISSVESLYLNNNQITSISNVSFAGFIELQTLHLEFNNIVNIHPKAFSTLKSLKILNLSDNKDLQVTGDVFSNLRGLASLTMMNNKKSFDFQHTENASFEQDTTIHNNRDVDANNVSNRAQYFPPDCAATLSWWGGFRALMIPKAMPDSATHTGQACGGGARLRAAHCGGPTPGTTLISRADWDVDVRRQSAALQRGSSERLRGGFRRL